MDGVDPVDAFYRVLWTEKEYTFCRLLSVGPRHGSAVCGTMWNPGSCHGGSGNAEGSTATQGLPDTRDSKHLVIFQSLKLNFLQAQSSIAINYHQLSLEHIRAKHLTTKSENPPWISCEVYPRHIPGPWSAERALECWEHPQTGKTWSFRVFLRCFFFWHLRIVSCYLDSTAMNRKLFLFKKSILGCRLSSETFFVLWSMFFRGLSLAGRRVLYLLLGWRDSSASLSDSRGFRCREMATICFQAKFSLD